MSAIPASVGAPSRPQVSLIPPEFARRRNQAAARALAMLVVLIGVAVSLAAWFFASGVRIVAEDGLTEEQAKREDLATKTAQFDGLLEAQQRHERAITAQAWVALTDVRWDDYLAAIGAALPDSVEVRQLDVAQSSPASGLAEPATSPFATGDLGLITIAGVTTDQAGAYAAARALEEISGISDVTVSNVMLDPNVTQDFATWVFTLNARISFEAWSGRTIIEGSEPE